MNGNLGQLGKCHRKFREHLDQVWFLNRIGKHQISKWIIPTRSRSDTKSSWKVRLRVVGNWTEIWTQIWRAHSSSHLKKHQPLSQRDRFTKHALRAWLARTAFSHCGECMWLEFHLCVLLINSGKSCTCSESARSTLHVHSVAMRARYSSKKIASQPE